MKNKLLVVVLLFFVGVSYDACSQKLSKQQKQEKKVIKAQMKSMDPFEFKKVMEENTSLKEEVMGLNDRTTTLQQQLDGKDAEINSAKAEAADARMKMDQMTTEMNSQKGTEENEVVVTQMSSKGVIFKVQIGAFRNKNLAKYFENNKNFSGDVDSDGTKKYTLGYFREYWEADTFKKYLREMGVKDAWIVPYKDGQRVNIKDVLEEQSKKKAVQ